MQVSKLGKLQCKSEGSSKQDLKAEDLRQMFLAMTEEVSFFLSHMGLSYHGKYTTSVLKYMTFRTS
jgi:hypothetical protein